MVFIRKKSFVSSHLPYNSHGRFNSLEFNIKLFRVTNSQIFLLDYGALYIF